MGLTYAIIAIILVLMMKTLFNQPKEIDMKKELKKLMKVNDFTLERQKKHLFWRHKNGAVVVTSKTASDHRALKNIASQIKKEVGEVRYD